jgi:hypothetical protein
VDHPNLFDYATSELSQDAFLCWLLSWAHRDFRDTDGPLHRTALTFLTRLLVLHGIAPPEECRTLKIERQYEDIDIVVLVNDDLALLIEDKTFTSEHSDQLSRYLDTVREDFEGRKVAPIFLKTGDQSSYDAAKQAGYALFLRRDLLSVLEEGERLGVTSDIFHDFVQRLRRIEEAVQSFRHIPVHEWGRDSRPWIGFFIALQERLEKAKWSYVPNPAGGFMGFYWHWAGHAYLQLEEAKLCFKIMVEDKAQQEAKWHEWHNRLMATCSQFGLSLERPSRRRSGTWMTVALLAGDYRQQGEGGLIDLDATVALLRKAECLVDTALTNPA